jgi:hypothetical protein
MPLTNSFLPSNFSYFFPTLFSFTTKELKLRQKFFRVKNSVEQHVQMHNRSAEKANTGHNHLFLALLWRRRKLKHKHTSTFKHYDKWIPATMARPQVADG